MGDLQVRHGSQAGIARAHPNRSDPGQRRGRSAATRVGALIVVALSVAACLAAPHAGRIVATGSLTTSRYHHTATLLSDGRVLIAGGDHESCTNSGCTTSYFDSAELYDPSTGTFRLTGSMTTPRSDHTATLLHDGRVLIAGGRDSANEAYASAELYDPATGTFRPTGSMTSPRVGDAAVLLSDGRVLVAGGASAEVYDPKSGAFSPTGAMSIKQLGSTAVLRNGEVLISGGIPSASLLSDGKALIAGSNGGYGSSVVAELYDPRTGEFTSTGEWAATEGGEIQGRALYDPKTGMLNPLGQEVTSIGDTVIALADGRGMIAGAGCAADACWPPEVLDPDSNTFVDAGADQDRAPDRYATMTLLKDGRVLFAGGPGGDTWAGLFVP